MPRARIARITTRNPKDGRARMRGEREVCANGVHVASVVPHEDEWFFSRRDSRLPTRNTLMDPFDGQRTWLTRDEAQAACVRFVHQNLAALAAASEKPAHHEED